MTAMISALTTSADAGELYGALAKATMNMQRVVKSKKADAGRYAYTYADLASALEACQDALAQAGVCVIQGVRTYDVAEGSRVQVTTRLGHVSGQWAECSVDGWPTRDGVQGVGSTITYLRRYSLLAMVGLAPEDDDGQAAQRSSGPPPRQQSPLADNSLRQQCGRAMAQGWTQEQIAQLLRQHGAGDARIASLPSSNRQAFAQALAGDPPQDEQADTQRLLMAIVQAMTEERWQATEAAALVTYGAQFMTGGSVRPQTIDDVPDELIGRLCDVIDAPYADWSAQVDSDGWLNALDHMTAQRADAVLQMER